MKGLEICRRTLTSSTGLISGRFKEDVKRSCQNAGAEFIVVAREISKCVTSSLLSPSLLSKLPIYRQKLRHCLDYDSGSYIVRFYGSWKISIIQSLTFFKNRIYS